MDTLDDLGAQLHALTSGQPAQPGDRVPGVTRRARRIRRTRAAVAVAAAVAVLAPVGALVANGHQDRQPRFARSDVTQWPDRSMPQYTGIGDGVIRAILDHDGAAVLDVRWLYRGRIALPDHNPTYVAVLTAEVSGQDVLVAATSFGTDLDATGRPTGGEGDGWDTSHRIVLDPAQPVRTVGVYLPYFAGDRQRAMALVLGDPRARTLTWTTTPLPFAPPSVAESSEPTVSANGVFLPDLGAITGPADVVLRDGRGATLRTPLSAGLSAPVLTPPGDPDVPQGWVQQSSVRAQSAKQDDGTWSGALGVDMNTNPHRPLTVFARCYGGGTETFELIPYKEGTALSDGPAAARGTVPCDGATHRAFAPVTLSSPGDQLTMTSTGLQAFSYVLAHRG